MNTHDIKLPPHDATASLDGMKPVRLYSEAKVRAAIEADRQERLTAAEEVCAEAYQVVGILLSDLGIFETDRASKILDNLSEARIVHDDVLPWPSLDRQAGGEAVGQQIMIAFGKYVAGYRPGDEDWTEEDQQAYDAVMGCAPQPQQIPEPSPLRESMSSNHRSYAEGWNACRAAMLGAAPEPKENP